MVEPKIINNVNKNDQEPNIQKTIKKGTTKNNK